jgi:acyl-CoA thioesterase I
VTAVTKLRFRPAVRNAAKTAVCFAMRWFVNPADRFLLQRHAMTLPALTQLASALAVLLTVTAQAVAQPATVNVVAIGASNTWGWGVSRNDAYPERLQELLKTAGYNAHVVNAGVVLDTTAGMLRRVDAAVPDGTHVVILQPGGNDARFLRSKEQRAANIDAMVKRLSARKIRSIVYDPTFAPDDYQWDRIHLTAQTHARIASELLPQVEAIIKPKQQQAPPPPAKRR